MRRDLDARARVLREGARGPAGRPPRARRARDASIARPTTTLRLTEILLRQAEGSGSNIEGRVGALVEAAGLYSQLGRQDDAISTWEQVQSVRARARRRDLRAREPVQPAGPLARRRRSATSAGSASSRRSTRRSRCASSSASSTRSSCTTSRPRSTTTRPRSAATRSSRPRSRHSSGCCTIPTRAARPPRCSSRSTSRQHRWHDLIRVYEAKLESAADPSERLRLTRFVARLYEEQLEDFERASVWYAKVFREEPSDPGVRDQLQRLASIVEQLGVRRADVPAYLDDETGESSDVREVAIAAAAIYDRRLNNVDAAYLALSPRARDRHRRRGSRTRASSCAGSRSCSAAPSKWNELVAVYDDVIARGDERSAPRGADQARAPARGRPRGTRRGRSKAGARSCSSTEGGGSPAIEHAYREAVGELERLYRRPRRSGTSSSSLLEARLGARCRRRDRGGRAAAAARRRATRPSSRTCRPRSISTRRSSTAEQLWERARRRARAPRRPRRASRADHRAARAGVPRPGLVAEARRHPRREARVHPAIRSTRSRRSTRSPTIHEERGGAIDLALGGARAGMAHRCLRRRRADEAACRSPASSRRGTRPRCTVEDGAQSAAQRRARRRAVGACGRDPRGAAQRSCGARSRRGARSTRRAPTIWSRSPRSIACSRSRAASPSSCKVVERRAELTEDAGVRLVLLHRVAALYEEVLERQAERDHARTRTCSASTTPTSLRSTRSSGCTATPTTARELARHARAQDRADRAISPPRQALRHAAAQVYEHQLDDVYQAIGQLTAILDDDAGEPTALAELDRIYAKQKLWPELLDIVDRRALLATTAKRPRRPRVSARRSSSRPS